MTHIFRPDGTEIRKWREQANKAAITLKDTNIDQPTLKIGFVFNDGVITVELETVHIRTKTKQQLADFLYEAVLAAAQTNNGGGHA